MAAVSTYVAVAGLAIGAYGASNARSSQRRQLQIRNQQNYINWEASVASAESGVAAASMGLGRAQDYASRVMEMAGIRRQVGESRAAFTKAQGQYDYKRGLMTQKQFIQKAEDTIALGQRVAIEEGRAGDQLSSTGLVLTGAGGITAEDTLRERAGIEAKGVYNARTALWEGDTQAADQRYQGAIAKHEGVVSKRVSNYNSALQMIEAGLQYDESALSAKNAIWNAEMNIHNAQSELNALRSTEPAQAKTRTARLPARQPGDGK